MVNYDITNRHPRCGFLLMFNTFHMSVLLQYKYRLLKCDGIVYNLDLGVNVKFDITSEILRCDIPLIFHKFHVYFASIRCSSLLLLLLMYLYVSNITLV